MIIKRREFNRPVRKKRAVAYCRVSTTEQEESYDTQYAVYKRMIDANEALEFAGIYSDLGKSGTNSEHRDGFKHMIRDAEKRKFDLIYVKSISRFARNVGDCQRYVDKLRELDIVVIFEREKIRTDDPTSNFALALIGAVSQDESHSISKNVQMGYRHRFSQGEFRLGNNRVLGYDTDEITRKLVPNENAWIVKEIFERFINGESMNGIATTMNEKGARTLRGKPFTMPAVRYILTNETYVGDKHLQKKAPLDYITHKPDPNETAPDYYLTDDHDAIVTREVWEAAQKRIEQVAEAHKNGDTGAQHHAFYGKIYCGECGALFTRRTFKNRDGSKYKSWNCIERQKGKNGNGCKCRYVKEEDLTGEVCKKFDWDEFRETEFLENVERIVVLEDRINILMKVKK